MPVWIILGVVAACFVLLGAWLIWSLMRRAASDSAAVAEEYAEFLRNKAADASAEERSESAPPRTSGPPSLL